MGKEVALRFAPGQPNNKAGDPGYEGQPEPCLQFWDGDFGKMNDQICKGRKRNLVCETNYL